MSGFAHRGDRTVHRGQVWDVVVADYTAPDGAPFQRDIVRSPGAVAVVPLLFDPEGNPSVVMVDQYRPPYDRRVLEIPAGMRDVAGEPPAQTAARELREEAGLVAGRLDHLLDLYPSPGMTDSVLSIYLATDCQESTREVHGPEEEDMALLHLPLHDALGRIDRGEVHDAKTVVGLLLTARRLARSDAGDG